GRYKLVLNFKELEYISSAGLGVIMGNIEEIRSHDGDIKLSDMSEKIFRVFDLVGFPSLYDIFDSQEEAESAFEKGE
ncbi:MAG: STAS domain-containing protein, partial [Candidatus Marinimicrobia bacterium]|nr:STAS domain-containing protein [Candidatus Neomarinimicrobiota bacterium]